MAKRFSLSERGKKICLKGAVFVVLLVGAIFVILPLLWALSSSFKTYSEIFTYPMHWIPEKIVWENYSNAVKTFPLLRYLMNSTIVASSVVAFNLLLSSLAAYSLSKFRYIGRDILFIVILGIMIIPRQVLAIPSFLVVKQFGLVNRYFGLMVPVLSAPIAIFILRQTMLSIPDALIDAARIDGAGELRIFFTLVMPLSKPALITMAIVMYIFTWNEMLWPLLVLGDPQKYTMPLGLSLLLDIYVEDFHLLFPAVIIAITPTLIAYLFLQRHFIKGLALSGTKG